MTIKLESLLTCPACSHAEPLAMPTNACQWFYECPACKVLLKPKPGDCCVFCSYGSVPCPPIQKGRVDCCIPGALAWTIGKRQRPLPIKP